MVVINPKPTFLTDYKLKVGADNFEKAVNSVLITPQTNVLAFKGGTPDANYKKTVVTGHQIAIGYVQDWESPVSLSRYLQANAGLDVLVEFTPNNGNGMTVKATVTIVPGPVGGNADTPATSTVTLDVTGVPTYTYPATA